MPKLIAWKKLRVGVRIRFLEPPETTAWWRQNRPKEWFPSYGMHGTIVALPTPGMIGGGPQIRWNNGRVTWIGSVSEYEVVG